MPVYIDDMYKYDMGKFGRMKMSHMIADDEDELHLIAARIGIARKWYQGDHYDVSKKMREKAIALGAIPISLKTLGTMTYVRRVTGKLPKPEDAKELWREARGQIQANIFTVGMLNDMEITSVKVTIERLEGFGGKPLKADTPFARLTRLRIKT